MLAKYYRLPSISVPCCPSPSCPLGKITPSPWNLPWSLESSSSNLFFHCLAQIRRFSQVSTLSGPGLGCGRRGDQGTHLKEARRGSCSGWHKCQIRPWQPARLTLSHPALHTWPRCLDKAKVLWGGRVKQSTASRGCPPCCVKWVEGGGATLPALTFRASPTVVAVVGRRPGMWWTLHRFTLYQACDLQTLAWWMSPLIACALAIRPHNLVVNYLLPCICFSFCHVS